MDIFDKILSDFFLYFFLYLKQIDIYTVFEDREKIRRYLNVLKTLRYLFSNVVQLWNYIVVIIDKPNF